MVRHCLGLRPPSGGRVLIPHRAAGAIVNIPGGEALYVSSLYLYYSQGLSDLNIGLLSHVAAALEVRAGPCILGADFIMEPSVFQESEFARSCGGRVVVPEAASGSCLAPGGLRLPDYFVVSSGLSKGLSKVLVEHAACASPRSPVSL
eukprot:8035314-Pyramimonas_sp.AAC.1